MTDASAGSRRPDRSSVTQPGDGRAPVVFFHAHPDDEAIFTGGTIRLLADAGHVVVVVIATSGEEGAGAGGDLAGTRQAESRAAAQILGVAEVIFLDYRDSGIRITGAGYGPGPDPNAFSEADPDDAAARLAAILAERDAAALVIYDELGIYDHPDHVQAHRVGRAAHTRSGVPTCYEVTVDREYLHFVETHLVEAASASLPGRADERHVGLPSVLIDLTVDVRAALPHKRAAMLAHVSQIPDNTFPVTHDDTEFAAVYGYEWYVRHGAPGPIEQLPGPGR